VRFEQKQPGSYVLTYEVSGRPGTVSYTIAPAVLSASNSVHPTGTPQKKNISLAVAVAGRPEVVADSDHREGGPRKSTAR
jgi:hypothetical protein